MNDYKLFEETLSDRENGRYVTYGVETCSTMVHDVSTSRAAVAALVDNLNAGAASQMQLCDILEDFLP